MHVCSSCSDWASEGPSGPGAGSGAESRAEGSHDEKDHALFYQPSIDKKKICPLQYN